MIVRSMGVLARRRYSSFLAGKDSERISPKAKKKPGSTEILTKTVLSRATRAGSCTDQTQKNTFGRTDAYL